MSLVNKYIDSDSFLTAISVYSDEALLSLAPDGYYQINGNYRRQLNGLLGPLVLCQTCQPDVTLFNLCFAVTENDLCCDTSTPVVVYAAGLNVANLSSVVGDLYKDSFLQIKADNGFYSDDSGITCSSSTLTKFDTSVGNPTGDCSSPQLTSLYFQVISPATNQAPLVTNSVFSDANGTIPLNNTSTTMYYIASLTAYGVRLGVVVSIAACTTPPTIAAIQATTGGYTCGGNSSGVFTNTFYIDSSYSMFIEVNGVLKINNTSPLIGLEVDIKQKIGETIDSRSINSLNSTVLPSTVATTFLVNQSSLANPSGPDMEVILTNQAGSQPVIYFNKCN